MAKKLKCPFCGAELGWCLSCPMPTMICSNENCKGFSFLMPPYCWQELIQAKQDLKQSEKCCSAWEIQALDYKAETIALSGKLGIARKALEEIDTTRCIPQQTLISLGKCSKTTRFNAGNIICVATPDYIHNTLEQIKHKEQK